MATDDKYRADWKVVDGTLKPLGYAKYTTLTSAVGLDDSPAVGVARPAGARLALIVVTGQVVAWRDDGTSPTAANGLPIAVSTPFWYNGDLAAIEFIETAASAVLHVSYYA